MESLSPLWRRSLIESGMRPRTTRLDVLVVVLFVVVAVILLAVFLPGFVSR